MSGSGNERRNRHATSVVGGDRHGVSPLMARYFDQQAIRAPDTPGYAPFQNYYLEADRGHPTWEVISDSAELVFFPFPASALYELGNQWRHLKPDPRSEAYMKILLILLESAHELMTAAEGRQRYRSRQAIEVVLMPLPGQSGSGERTTLVYGFVFVCQTKPRAAEGLGNRDDAFNEQVDHQEAMDLVDADRPPMRRSRSQGSANGSNASGGGGDVRLMPRTYGEQLKKFLLASTRLRKERKYKTNRNYDAGGFSVQTLTQEQYLDALAIIHNDPSLFGRLKNKWEHVRLQPDYVPQHGNPAEPSKIMDFNFFVRCLERAGVDEQYYNRDTYFGREASSGKEYPFHVPNDLIPYCRRLTVDQMNPREFLCMYLPGFRVPPPPRTISVIGAMEQYAAQQRADGEEAPPAPGHLEFGDRSITAAGPSDWDLKTLRIYIRGWAQELHERRPTFTGKQWGEVMSKFRSQALELVMIATSPFGQFPPAVQAITRYVQGRISSSGNLRTAVPFLASDVGYLGNVLLHYMAGLRLWKQLAYNEILVLLPFLAHLHISFPQKHVHLLYTGPPEVGKSHAFQTHGQMAITGTFSAQQLMQSKFNSGGKLDYCVVFCDEGTNLLTNASGSGAASSRGAREARSSDNEASKLHENLKQVLTAVGDEREIRVDQGGLHATEGRGTIVVITPINFVFFIAANVGGIKASLESRLEHRSVRHTKDINVDPNTVYQSDVTGDPKKERFTQWVRDAQAMSFYTGVLSDVGCFPPVNQIISNYTLQLLLRVAKYKGVRVDKVRAIQDMQAVVTSLTALKAHHIAFNSEQAPSNKCLKEGRTQIDPRRPYTSRDLLWMGPYLIAGIAEAVFAFSLLFDDKFTSKDRALVIAALKATTFVRRLEDDSGNFYIKELGAPVARYVSEEVDGRIRARPDYSSVPTGTGGKRQKQITEFGKRRYAAASSSSSSRDGLSLNVEEVFSDVANDVNNYLDGALSMPAIGSVLDALRGARVTHGDESFPVISFDGSRLLFSKKIASEREVSAEVIIEEALTHPHAPECTYLLGIPNEKHSHLLKSIKIKPCRPEDTHPAIQSRANRDGMAQLENPGFLSGEMEYVESQVKELCQLLGDAPPEDADEPRVQDKMDEFLRKTCARFVVDGDLEAAFIQRFYAEQGYDHAQLKALAPVFPTLDSWRQVASQYERDTGTKVPTYAEYVAKADERDDSDAKTGSARLSDLMPVSVSRKRTRPWVRIGILEAIGSEAAFDSDDDNNDRYSGDEAAEFGCCSDQEEDEAPLPSFIPTAEMLRDSVRRALTRVSTESKRIEWESSRDSASTIPLRDDDRAPPSRSPSVPRPPGHRRRLRQSRISEYNDRGEDGDDPAGMDPLPVLERPDDGSSNSSNSSGGGVPNPFDFLRHIE